MHVIATAGHVDHGKSTLVRALSGMEPDRLAEERQRGLTIDLGFAWMNLPSGAQLAFVDVPGHERFVTNMLAGVGTVPAVMFVVAADEGWMPQSEEHLAALDALGVRDGLLVVTRSDLADPEYAIVEAREHLAGTNLAAVPAVAVSSITGAGLDTLRAELDDLVARLPGANHTGPVRLWIDRVFTIKGSGTVVTGTLPAGTLRAGDELLLAPSGMPVRVRGLQALKVSTAQVDAVARVAVNLRGVDRSVVSRGMALVTPRRWVITHEVDAWVDIAGGIEAGDAGLLDLPSQLMLHIGSARVPARVRWLDLTATGRGIARITLASALPMHIGDVGLLRDPHQLLSRSRIAARVTIVDVRPPVLRRRGAAARRARVLGDLAGIPDEGFVVRRHGVIRRDDVIAMGVESRMPPVVAQWLADPERWADLRERLTMLVARHAADFPLERGVPVEAARRALALPSRDLVEALVHRPLRISDGRIHDERHLPEVPTELAEAVSRLRHDLTKHPFRAPESDELRALGLDHKMIGAAVRAGLLARIADGIVLLPDAEQAAARVLADLPQPFTTSQARIALDTTRRVVIPLLELLDRRRITERVNETSRRCRSS